jgi:hypothetical protein
MLWTTPAIWHEYIYFSLDEQGFQIDLQINNGVACFHIFYVKAEVAIKTVVRHEKTSNEKIYDCMNREAFLKSKIKQLGKKVDMVNL